MGDIPSNRPTRYDRFEYPSNVWLGKSISRQEDCYRVIDLRDMKSKNTRSVSIDPIHERINFWFLKKATDWIILGAETGHRKRVKSGPRRNG